MKPVLSWMAEISEILLIPGFEGNEIWRSKEMYLQDESKVIDRKVSFTT